MKTRDLMATVVGVALAAVMLPPTPAMASTSTSTISIASGARSWTPSGNAKIATIGSRALQLKPKRAAGRKNVSMRSRVSTTRVDQARSVVRVDARLRTSQPGRRLTLRVKEVAGGRVVSTRSVSVKPSNRRWRTVAVALRTTRAGSRLQVQVQAKRLRHRHVVQLASLAVTADGRQVEVPGPGPGAPGPGVPSAACEDIDYSDPEQGVRTFTDDFDGTAIDRTRWRVRDNTFLNHDKAWITKDAVTVRDGYLAITGRRIPDGQWKTNTGAFWPNENSVRDYSTGYVDTMDGAGYGNAAGQRFSQKYGHFEVRAWVPSESTMSRGIWPAFWLRADRQPGEIDPMESYGGPTIRNFDPSSSYEWNSWADTSEGSQSGIVKRQTHGRADVGPDKIWQGWHTYGVNWSPRCLRYTYDGRTVGVVDFDDPATASYFRGPTFDDTFHIRLNMQVGSRYWGWADPAHTRPEFTYKIDWVRVHQGKELLGR